MIDYIKGLLAELTPAKAVIEAAGVGYELNISLSTYDQLNKLESADKVTGSGSQSPIANPTALLYVYEDIREDAWVLFGFGSKMERELFLLLISVSGVGGNTARTILSAYPAPELANIIANGQDGMLKRVKGIGGKTAQRIIVELQDKAVQIQSQLGIDNGQWLMANGEPQARQLNGLSSRLTPEGEEAVAALQMLGFSPAPTKKAVKTLLEKDPGLTAEQIIKQALKMI